MRQSVSKSVSHSSGRRRVALSRRSAWGLVVAEASIPGLLPSRDMGFQITDASFWLFTLLFGCALSFFVLLHVFAFVVGEFFVRSFVFAALRAVVVG